MRVPSLIEELPDRWRHPGIPAYAWWIPVFFIAAAFLAVAGGIAQRVGTDGAWPVLGLGLLALTPWVADVLGMPRPWIPLGFVTLAAVGLAVTRYPVEEDVLPLLWPVLAGHLGAVERFWRGAAATAAALVLVAGLGLATDLPGTALWLGAIVIGWDIGVVMQFQQRRLDDAAATQAAQRARAVLEERQRIAREVHDVLAHTMSVTLLHLTSARRNLEEDREDGVDEAVEALRDAERHGREAMAEIRRSVGLLGRESGGTAPAPDLSDLPTLVSEFEAAGLDVTLERRGSGDAVGPHTGLHLYRIAQESLANVAKHQPHARAVVTLEATPRRQVLRIANTLSSPVARADGGSGLNGMRQRAELIGASFSAGERDGSWVVEVEAGTSSFPSCPLPQLTRRSRLLGGSA